MPSTQGNAFLALLATINSKAVPDPPSENDPIQKVSIPYEKVTLSDTVATTIGGGPAKYGVALYGQATYV